MWGARRTTAGDVEAALELLTVAERHRAGELAVWTAAAPIERALVAPAWARTGGLGTSATERLCADLLDLELIVEGQAGLAPSGHVAAVRMRAALSDELARAAAAALVELARGSLPPEARGAAPAWWQLPAESPSLWAGVPALLHASGCHEELAELLADLRWTVAKVRILGAAAVEADLGLVATPWAAAAAGAVARAALQLERARAWDRGVHAARALGSIGERAAELRDATATTVADQLADDPRTASLVAALRATWGLAPRLSRCADAPASTESPVRRTLATGGGLSGHVCVEPARLISVGNDVEDWDLASGRTMLRYRALASTPDEVALAPDGSWLAVPVEAGRVHVVDRETGALLAALAADRAAVLGVVAGRDGTWLATAGTERTVRIWDTATGALRRSIPRAGPFLLAVAAAQGELLVAHEARTLTVLDPADGGAPRVIGKRGRCVARRITGAGAWLVFLDFEDAGVEAIDIISGERAYCLTPPRDPWLAAPSSATWLAIGGRGEASVELRDGATGELRATLADHRDVVSRGVAAPDGSWLATSSWDGTVRIWDPATGAVRQRIDVKATALVASADSTWLAVADRDGRVAVWDVVAGGMRAEGPSACEPIASAPDGCWLALSDRDSIELWDVPAASVPGAPIATRSRAISPVAARPAAPADGRWSATIDPDRTTVRVSAAKTGATLATLPERPGPPDPDWDWRVHELEVAPDGGFLALTGMSPSQLIGRGVRIVRVARADDDRMVLEDVVGLDVESCAISPDGRWLAVTQRPADALAVFDTTSWRVVATAWLEAPAHGCAWLPDGGRLRVTVLGAAGRPLAVYDFDPGDPTR